MSSRNNWTGPHTIAVRKISASHAVEANRHTPRRYLTDPVYLIPRRGLLGGLTYRVHDGNRRLRDAVARGDRTIRAYVKADR